MATSQVAPLPTPPSPALPPQPEALRSAEGDGGEETNLDWVETALQDDELRARFIAAVSDPQLYSDAELAQLQAGLLMESEVNEARLTGASGTLSSSSSQAKATLKSIKTSSLLDNAVAMVSKDGRENIVQASGTIRASLMSVAAYMFVVEQGHLQLMMEEESVNLHRIVEHKNDHALVFHYGFKMPSPLHDRDGAFLHIFQQLDDGDNVMSVESIEHDQAPPQDGVIRAYARRLVRFSPVSPGVTRLTVTSTFDVRGSIPRFISRSFTTPAAARAPLDALRYYNQVKSAGSFEAADAKELGQLLVLDMDAVRGKKDRRPLEAMLRTFVDRSAVLRGARSRFPWLASMLVEVLRNQVHRPSNTLTPLAEFGDKEGKKVGGAFALLQLKKVSPAAAVEAWISGNPALGNLTME
jgi:hypothetical protein